MTIIARLRAMSVDQPTTIAYRFYGSSTDETRAVTFAELYHSASMVAAEVARRTRPADRVLIAAPSGIEYLVGFFGSMLAGRIPVPLSPPKRRDAADAQFVRMQTVVRNCEPSLVLTINATITKLIQSSTLTAEAARLPWMCIDELLATGKDTFDGPMPSHTDVAFLQYTSGSTTSPRGVVVCHDNLTANLTLCARVFRLTAESRLCGWLPLFHDMGLIGLALQAVHSGCPYFFMSPSSFLQRPIRWLEMLSDSRATCTGAPNFVFDLCSERVMEAPADLDLSNLDMLFCGAEPIRQPDVERFVAAFEPFRLNRGAIAPAFGLAEATLVVSLDTRAAGPRSRARPNGVSLPVVDCGVVQPEFAVAVVDPASGLATAPGVSGEIWLSGPCVCRGYWNAPQATTEVFGAVTADGSGPWLRTGDLGFIDDCNLHVTGRLKDVIIIAGQNYYPQDIEATALSRLDVLEHEGACAFEFEDLRGPSVVVVVEIRRTARKGDLGLIAREIAQLVVRTHNIPVSDVAILPPRRLPRTTSGKLQRQKCRIAYESGDLPFLARTKSSTPSSDIYRERDSISDPMPLNSSPST